MAHIARLSSLVDELVTTLTSTSTKFKPEKFEACRQSTLRTLKPNHYSRINQFDVKDRLGGLEEKFRIYGEDQLADALRERIDILDEFPSKWTPEVLHLLLELSDKPVEKSNVRDLELLREPEPEHRPLLQWEDLAADDPLLRESSIWENVDFGTGSSDDEEFVDHRSEASELTETTVSSIVEDPLPRRLEGHLVDTSDRHGLEKLRGAQFWQSKTKQDASLDLKRRCITELDAIRDIIFMFLGLPSSLFEIVTGDTVEVKTSRLYFLRHVSTDAFHTLLYIFADKGSRILALRLWIKRQQIVPLMQVFQHSIIQRLNLFDRSLSDMQHRLIAPHEDVLVSLLRLQNELEPHAKLLEQLSEITKRLDQEQYAHAFRYLELLYEETCMAQAAGNDTWYEFVGNIFFDCLRIYLRPIRIWMEDGELIKRDGSFFILDTNADTELASIWESRFKLRQTQDGVLHAPKFLHSAAQKIFNTGKSVVMLKFLNKVETLDIPREKVEPSLDFQTVCGQVDKDLIPFAETFASAFDAWIKSKHHFASFNLRKQLFDSWGLQEALGAMTQIYFMSDGAASSTFSNPLFDKLDSLDTTWNDRFTLTELARSAFDGHQSVVSDHLRAHILLTPRRYREVAKCRRTVKTLAIIELKYRLTWPIQIILTPSTARSYQKIFTFLLQIRRSSHMLYRQRLLKDQSTYTSSRDESSLHYSLRTRLLWFTQTLYYYITCLVISPNVEKLNKDLVHADDIDAMIEVHRVFIKNSIDQTLLGSRLELIHKTILTILDLSIKLEDARAANEMTQKEAMERQQEMVDISFASLGLHTPKKKTPEWMSPRRHKARNSIVDSSDDSDDEEADMDMSVLSPGYGDSKNISYLEKLWSIKSELDRSVRFVTSGLRGVARASGAEESKAWDLLGEMLDVGINTGRL
ncbi:Spc98 family-domain-containing protein [Xylogone sp. PMI_703]|nr:Spc98 family-domain-containing protein [Xylogone sp. PMI_703]